MSDGHSTKFCNSCGYQKPMESFETSLRSRDGRKYVCKDCNAAKFATKVCNGCGLEKPRDEFYADKRSKTSGLFSKCKKCTNSREKADREALNPNQKLIRLERKRSAQFKCRYGINQIGYDRMIAEQNGRCAICGSEPSRHSKRTQKLYIDHDHETGHVRGLICRRCNAALGVFGDNIEGVMNVLDYLSRAKLAHAASMGIKIAQGEDA